MKLRTKLLLVLAFAAVIGFIMLKPHGSSRQAVEAYKQELRARGEKLTIAELAPAGSPKARQAGIRFTNAMTGIFSTPLRVISGVAPGVARINHTNLPSLVMISYPRDRAKMEELRAILVPDGVDLDMDYSKGLWLNLTPIVAVRNAEFLAENVSMQCLYTNDFPEAWANLSTALDLLNLWERQPFPAVIVQRGGVAVAAVRATWEFLQCNHNWTDQELSQLQDKWEAMDFLRSSESIWTMNRAAAIDALAVGRTNFEMYVRLFEGRTIWNPSGPSQGTVGPANGIRNRINYLYNRYLRSRNWQSAWSYEEEMYYLQLSTLVVESTRRIQQKQSFRLAYDPFEKGRSVLHTAYPDRVDHFSNLTLTHEEFVTNYFDKIAIAEVTRQLVVTAIALRRFHGQHGIYPADLKDLVPGFLGRVPIDLMGNGPLHYQLNSDGTFLLYSVGLNGRDDGGDATPIGAGSGADFMNCRDILWPRAATAQELEEFERRAQPTNGPTAR